MESCVNTEKDIDKVIAKFGSYKKQYESSLQQLEDQMNKLKSELQQLPPDEPIGKHHAVVMQYNKKIKTTGQKLSTSHKELHSSVSRVGKTIDKNFDADCSSVFPVSLCQDVEHERLLNQAVCEHYYRQGLMEVAGDLSQEAQLDIVDDWKKLFMDMNGILHSLRERNLDPALAWAEQNHDKLKEKTSNLEFLLHRLKFIEILKRGPQAQSEALKYSRRFQDFAQEHSKEIQTLMGSFLYMRQGLVNSPYSTLLHEQNWNEIARIFMKDACSILGLSIDSPLLSSFTAGCTALPALIAIKSVIEQRHCSGVLNDKDELPIDIDMPPSQQYHSIFACPILRQQTTENNPPMRLACGHVISHDALKKLITANKIKCPYCPTVQAPGDAKRVFF